MKAFIHAISSVAYKELLHIWRDRRIVALILVLPPFFTLLFGYAFEASELTHVPAILQNDDQSPESEKFAGFLLSKDKFSWKIKPPGSAQTPDLLREGVQAAVIIPAGWGKSMMSGETMPLRLVADGSDTITVTEIKGTLQQFLGEFQLSQRDDMIANLPDSVMEMGKQLPVEIRRQFVSEMTPWTIDSEILYNKNLRFIEYVIPGIMGLILQLLTVTLMACTITREREAGTLSQLMVTSLTRAEIVIGKVVPYLGISVFLILSTMAVAYFHFHVNFRQPLALGIICLLFLLCSLGLGLLISAFCDSQTQAIQFAVFFLLPVFPLSGAFAPLQQLPEKIRFISELFPLTHFCRAFRLINLNGAGISFIVTDLVFLALGALVTCAGAAILLSRTQD
jgi:ABC-2 type transport system permease protein